MRNLKGITYNLFLAILYGLVSTTNINAAEIPNSSLEGKLPPELQKKSQRARKQQLEELIKNIGQILQYNNPCIMPVEGYQIISPATGPSWFRDYGGGEFIVGSGYYKSGAWGPERLPEDKKNEADIYIGEIKSGKISIQAINGNIMELPEGYGRGGGWLIRVKDKLDGQREISFPISGVFNPNSTNNPAFIYTKGNEYFVFQLTGNPLTDYTSIGELIKKYGESIEKITTDLETKK